MTGNVHAEGTVAEEGTGHGGGGVRPHDELRGGAQARRDQSRRGVHQRLQLGRRRVRHRKGALRVTRDDAPASLLGTRARARHEGSYVGASRGSLAAGAIGRRWTPARTHSTTTTTTLSPTPKTAKRAGLCLVLFLLTPIVSCTAPFLPVVLSALPCPSLLSACWPGPHSRSVEILPALEHGTLEYEPFNKEFYEEHAEVAAMTQADVEAAKRQLSLKTSGFNVPKPVASFAQVRRLTRIRHSLPPCFACNVSTSHKKDVSRGLLFMRE